LILLVPLIGFELMTYRLQGGCSTN